MIKARKNSFNRVLLPLTMTLLFSALVILQLSITTAANDNETISCCTESYKSNETINHNDALYNINNANLPNIAGRIVYHSYISYGDGTSQLFIFDFQTRTVENISASWTNVIDPMNAVWTADGQALVFMGRSTEQGHVNEYFHWDIFMYEIGAEGNPINLTNDPYSRNEDPKMYPGSNTKFVYKSTCGIDYVYRIRTMSIPCRTITTVHANPYLETAMPAFSYDGNWIYFTGLVGGPTGQVDIWRISRLGGVPTRVPKASCFGAFQYYSIPNETGIFFARHFGPIGGCSADQIYHLNTTTGELTWMPFNIIGCNTSDIAIIDQYYSIISCTYYRGQGGYDLFIVHNITGERWSLCLWNSDVNTEKCELGAWFTPTTRSTNGSGNLNQSPK